jgi:hypothetical protein
VPLVFHLVGDGDSTYETRRPVFEHLVAALLDAKVRFVTVAEALAG